MRLCPFCATENEAFFRFCLGCGADLDEALGGAGEAEAAPAVDAPAPVAVKPKAAPPAAPIAPTPVAGSRSLGPRTPAPSISASVKPAVPRSPEVRAKTAEGGSKSAGTPAARAVASANAEAAAARAPKPATGEAPGTPLRAPTFAKAEGAAGKRGGAEVAPPVVSKKGAAPKVRARLVMILEDGSDGQTIDVAGDTVTIGREGADITFPQDDFLAPRHAELVSAKGGGGLVLRPLESTNGVFLQVHEETELISGDVFRIGQQLLSFEVLSEVASDRGIDPRGGAERLGSPIPEGAWGRLGQIIAPGLLGSVYLLGGSEVYLGRERGDITFPGDGFVSGLHALVAARGGRYFLKDLGSSNGTYLRLTDEAPIGAGALVLAGQQLFRVEL